MPTSGRPVSPPRPSRRGPIRWAGPLPTWPRPVEHLVESWWRLPARLRLLAAVALVGLLAGGAVARASRSSWGPPVPVVVVTADVEPGSPVPVDVRPRPDGLVPSDALDRPPPSPVAARPLRRGQVLLAGDVGRGLDDLLRPGEVAIALAQDLPDLPAGARLDLLGTALDGTGRRLAPGRLLARRDDWTWVAIEQPLAADVASGLSTGGVTVALAPP